MNPGITATTTSGLNAPHNAAISARKLTLATTRILAEVSQGVGWITLNSPERRNAVPLKMWPGLSDAADAFEADPAVRHGQGAAGPAYAPLPHRGNGQRELPRHASHGQHQEAHPGARERAQRSQAGPSRPRLKRSSRAGGARAATGYALRVFPRATNHSERANKRRKQLQLCTAGGHNAGTHPRVKIQSAGWVKIESTPTDTPNSLAR